MQGKGQDKVYSNSVSQPPKFQARRDIKPSRNKIRNTTDDQDLWVLKERVHLALKERTCQFVFGGYPVYILIYIIWQK